MQDGIGVRKFEADGVCQVVAFDFGFGFFKRPGNIVQIAANGLAGAVDSEEAVALGNEMFERTAALLSSAKAWPQAAIARVEYDFVFLKTTAAVEREFTLRALLEVHLRPVVGQIVEGMGGHGGHQAAGVE